MSINRVLIVDDDAGIRRIAAISLRRIGKWDVLATDSLVNALEYVTDFKPDLILLDARMPGMDGPTTFRLLQENEDNARIPVIFLTAKIQEQEVKSYKQLGAAGIISKPFDPVTLSGEIRRILSDPIGAARVA
jgi:two-component system, OmpR family, response regulator